MNDDQRTSLGGDTISALRIQGFRLSKIAEELGHHRFTIYRALEPKACNDGRLVSLGQRSRSRDNEQFEHKDSKIVKLPSQNMKLKAGFSTPKRNEVLSVSHEAITGTFEQVSPLLLIFSLIFPKPRRKVESAINPIILEGYSRENAIFLNDPSSPRSEKDGRENRRFP